MKWTATLATSPATFPDGMEDTVQFNSVPYKDKKRKGMLREFYWEEMGGCSWMFMSGDWGPEYEQTYGTVTCLGT